MPDLVLETEVGGVVAGVDEAGRGPLAGPVTAAAVILVGDALTPTLTASIDDSKKLSAEHRIPVFDALKGMATIGVGHASVGEIDRLNILGATLLAMRRAVAALGCAVGMALVDGNQAPKLTCPVRCIVAGDQRCLSIAAASIVAKVTRDRYMVRLAAEYPGYGWERNVGYGTLEHREALSRLGPTPHHRRSFRPVAQHFAAAKPEGRYI